MLAIFIFIFLIMSTTINARLELCNQDSTQNCSCSSDYTKIDCSMFKYGENTKLEIFEEQRLTIAYFSSNSITDLTLSADLKNLKVLDLSNNKLKSLSYIHQFEHLTDLRELNLANNQIETIDAHTFEHLQNLENLNLSNSGSFRLTTHLCPLISLRGLDLSNLDLSDLDLSCWGNLPNQKINSLIEELYLKNSKNAFKTSWFRNIHTNLKILDLTNTNLVSMDSAILLHKSLHTLILSNNENINKTQVLQFIEELNLKRIDIARINASADNLDLKYIIQKKPQNLNYIDVSSNRYIDFDIDTIIIDIITNFQTFIGSKNQFISYEELNNTNKALLESTSTRLEVLNLSGNKLNSSLLYYIQFIESLRVLDLSNNLISLVSEEFISDDMVSLFSKMANLTDVNLSHNKLLRFITYFNESTKLINSFDLSHNLLDNFYILSSSIVREPTFPINLRPLNNQSNDNFDVDENTVDNDNADVDRFLNMNLLDLSSNAFTELNFKRQFKSVKNLKRLDASFNSKLKSINYLSYNGLLIKNIKNSIKEESSNIEWNQLITDNHNKFFHINELDLENCRIDELPSLEYVTINKISFANNQLKGNLIIKLTKFSSNFLKYLNLMNNDINSTVISVLKNDEILGITNSNLTYIDVKLNKNFDCDCKAFRELEVMENIVIMSDCDQTDDCASLNSLGGSSNNAGLFGITSNKRITFLIVIICAIITILIVLIVYSVFSDIRNLSWTNMGSVLLCCKLKFARLSDSNDDNDTNGAGGGRTRSRVPYVRLSRPSDEDNIEIEGF